MRSALQNAEAKAPRRVWRAVSARLDQAAASAWWRWAVPAFAVAALVALGLFLTGTFNNTKPLPGSDIIVAQTLTDSQDAAPASDGSVQAGCTDALTVSAAPASSRMARSRIAMERHTTDQSVPQSSEDIKTGVPSVAEEEAPVSLVSNEGVSDAEAAEAAARWALIEQEDARQASRITLSNLYAQGSVGGNDSNISYGGTGISRMAPGAGSADAGISESSSSTYGVPFTLGLGARFKVAPKLSLGTGLEYSLLTRTFTGTYSDSYTGTISHTVQYVGIPVNAYYDLFATRDGLLGIYAWGGGSAEVCVGNRYALLSEPRSVIRDKCGAFQFSTALGLGFEFRLSPSLGLYVDPSVRYYFHGNQPKSVRTDKPFMFNMQAGLRFNL